jgi:hypothetical protein
MKIFEFALDIFSLFHKYNYYNDRKSSNPPPQYDSHYILTWIKKTPWKIKDTLHTAIKNVMPTCLLILNCTDTNCEIKTVLN